MPIQLPEYKESVQQRLVKQYANGRKICNCGEAWTLPIGRALGPDGWIENYDICPGGCFTNKSSAAEYIMLRQECELIRMRAILGINQTQQADQLQEKEKNQGVGN